MITIMDRPKNYFGESMEEWLDGVFDPKDKVKTAIGLLKTLPINGCITGSCWLGEYDPVTWGSDIDLFVYSETELVKAIDLMLYGLKLKPGQGTERTDKQEEVKLNMLRQSGLNYKTGITSYKFYHDDIKVNVTYKTMKHAGKRVPLTNCPSVLLSFDMSIIMQGYDIQSHTFFDMRPANVDTNVAIPNPLRDHNCSMWNVDKWIRQFDRVVKYYNRGYDTRPMAEFYLDMIDKCIEDGYLFDNSDGQKMFETFSEEFTERRNIIHEWLEEHKED